MMPEAKPRCAAAHINIADIVWAWIKMMFEMQVLNWP
jgi:hypothetical protein